MSAQQQQPQQQQQQQPFAGGDYAERFVRVEKDVSLLKESMSSLATRVENSFSALTAELKARASFNWQPVSILAIVLIAFGGWGWALFGSFQARTDAALAELKATSLHFVPRADLADRFLTIKERGADAQRMTDARIERAERDLDDLRRQVVPRGEHEQMWAAQRTRDADMQRRTEDVDRAVRGGRGAP